MLPGLEFDDFHASEHLVGDFHPLVAHTGDILLNVLKKGGHVAGHRNQQDNARHTRQRSIGNLPPQKIDGHRNLKEAVPDRVEVGCQILHARRIHRHQIHNLPRGTTV